MVKLSEVKGEAALEMLADLFEPVVEICADPEIKKLYKAGNKIAAIAHAIKAHKKAVLSAMATLNQQPVNEYAKGVNVITLPVEILQALNDPDLVNLFTLQSRKGAEISSGSATANTEGAGQ